MERMKVKYVIDGKDYVTLPAYEMLEDKYNQLEEENKKLKEYQYWAKDKIEGLQYENKKLKSDLSYERTMLDNVRAEYKSLQNVIKKLKEEIKWRKDLVHKAKEFEYDEDGMDYIWKNTKI